MRKRLLSAIFLLLFLLMNCSCNVNDDSVIEETTLTLSMYQKVDGELVFAEVLPGVPYEKANNFFVLRESATIDVLAGNQLTVESNGMVHIVSDEGGMSFFFNGKDEDGLLVVDLDGPATFHEEYLSYRGGTFCYRFDPLENEEGWTRFDPPVGATRHFTISAYRGYNPELNGSPAVVMKVEITYTGRKMDAVSPLLESEYTLEILSVERTPPAYW